jgi:hypothetical protein
MRSSTRALVSLGLRAMARSWSNARRYRLRSPEFCRKKVPTRPSTWTTSETSSRWRISKELYTGMRSGAEWDHLHRDVGAAAAGDQLLHLLAHDLGRADLSTQCRLVKNGPQLGWVGFSQTPLAEDPGLGDLADGLRRYVRQDARSHCSRVAFGLQQARDEARVVLVDRGRRVLQADIGRDGVGQAVLLPPRASLAFSGEKDEAVTFGG